MTAEFIRSLVRAGETLNVEFKGEAQAPLNDRELVEAVVCLCNRPGSATGYLLVGVEDDGRITGARPRHPGGRTDPHLVQALLAGRTRPSQSCGVSQVEVDNVEVLAIEVPPCRTPVSTSDGKYLRRAIGGRGGPECLPYQFHEMQGMQADLGLLDYSTLKVPGAAWADLDPLEFERFRRCVRESRGRGDSSLLDLPDAELAKALGAVEANHAVTGIRVLGLLLFGKEESLHRWLPTHEVAFQALSGTSVEANDFFRWPLLRLMDELMSRLAARNREQEILMGMLRVAVPHYPERAVREAVANALIHRDFTRLGTVHIQWHEDRLEITNPGGFPEGVTLQNLLVTPPRPRNPLLADAFKRAGLVERTARGIDLIFEEQLRNGRPAPSYERSTPSDVVLVLPGGAANLDFVRWIVTEMQAGHTLGLDALLVLNRLWQERRLTGEQAAALIQKPPTDARLALQRMVETGWLKAQDVKGERAYSLTAAVNRFAGKASGLARESALEPLRQQEAVLQHLEQHGRITRREVAELCGLGPDQAKRLLQKLVEAQKIIRYGTLKQVWYERRP